MTAAESSASPAGHLGELRRQRGLTQADLARRVGVSRQFLNQMEAGRTVPSVLVALRVARELGTNVESLYGDRMAPESVLPYVSEDGPLMPGTRVRLGNVEGKWVAYPAESSQSVGSGYVAADGLIQTTEWVKPLRPVQALEANVVVCGCDPALALLQHITVNGQRGVVHWIDCASGKALQLLAAGRIHVAGIHYPGEDHAGNIAAVQECAIAQEAVLFAYTRWEQGWILRKDDLHRFDGPRALLSSDWRVAPRQQGSAASVWLSTLLTKQRIPADRIQNPGSPGLGAVPAARAVVTGAADLTVGPRAVAEALGLAYVPGEIVHFDLVALRDFAGSARGEALLRRLSEPALAQELKVLPGYADAETGHFISCRAKHRRHRLRNAKTGQ